MSPVKAIFNNFCIEFQISDLKSQIIFGKSYFTLSFLWEVEGYAKWDVFLP
jgi:hypothetical protein